jgi:hypothetical protein
VVEISEISERADPPIVFSRHATPLNNLSPVLSLVSLLELRIPLYSIFPYHAWKGLADIHLRRG